jgi:hypothetical protein
MNWNPFYIFAALIGLLFLWAFGWQVLGCFFVAVKWLSFGHLTWTPEKDKKSFFKSFSVHSQSGLFGPHWGIGFHLGGRRHFYFHDYMGWHNLSEMHRSDECNDSAYCLWHGNL